MKSEARHKLHAQRDYLIIILCSKNLIVKVDYQMKSGSMHNYSWHWLALVPIAIGIEIKVAKIFSNQYEKIIWDFMIAKYWGIMYNPSTQFFCTTHHLSLNFQYTSTRIQNTVGVVY